MGPAPARRRGVVIAVGNLPVRLWLNSPDFTQRIEERYSGFLSSSAEVVAEFEVELTPPVAYFEGAEVRVTRKAGEWIIERSDFRALWNPSTGRGRIQQVPSVYSLDAVLRIINTIVLAPIGGFLLHASSLVRTGYAALFTGPEGAGKTTIARLAPPSASLLSDDVSCVIRQGDTYHAMGTPFYCGLGRHGENLEAPIKTVYLLTRGPENKVEPVRRADAVRGLLRNILSFVDEPKLVKSVFETACDFADRVPVRRLTFTPNSSVWDELK